jgi:hypothetical protein
METSTPPSPVTASVPATADRLWAEAERHTGTTLPAYIA